MRILISTVVVIALIWLSTLFLSIESGLQLGPPYRVFFTLVVLFIGALFYLLRSPAMAPFKSVKRALGSALLVFIATVGLMVLLSNIAPQFAFEDTISATKTTGEMGATIFNDPNVGCFLCHAIDGVGGTRGPDLSHVASIVGDRQPGVSAEDYLKAALIDPGAFVVPTYDNIMPPLASRLSAEELDALIEYLETLK